MVLRRGVAVMLPVAVLAGESEKFFAFRPGGADDGSANEKVRLLTETSDTLCVLGPDNILTVPESEGFECGSCNIEGANYATNATCVAEAPFCLGDSSLETSEACTGEDAHPIWDTQYSWTANPDGTALDANSCVSPDDVTSVTAENFCGSCSLRGDYNSDTCDDDHIRTWEEGVFTGSCTINHVSFKATSADECGYCKSTNLDEAACTLLESHGIAVHREAISSLADGTCRDLEGELVSTNASSFGTKAKCGVCIDADGAIEATTDDTGCDPTTETWVPYFWYTTTTANCVAPYCVYRASFSNTCIDPRNPGAVLDGDYCSNSESDYVEYCELTDKSKHTCDNPAIDGEEWVDGTFESECTIDGTRNAALDDKSLNSCGTCSNPDVPSKDLCDGVLTDTGDWTSYTYVSETGKFLCEDTRSVVDAADACGSICRLGDSTSDKIVQNIATEADCLDLGTQRCLNPTYTNKTACQAGDNLWVNATWTEGLIVETTTTESGGIAVVVEEDEDDDSDCEASGGRSNLRGGGSLAAAAITALLTTVGAIFSSALVF